MCQNTEQTQDQIAAMATTAELLRSAQKVTPPERAGRGEGGGWGGGRVPASCAPAPPVLSFIKALMADKNGLI